MGWTAKKIEAACTRWYCPRVCQGQTVVVEYGYDSEGSSDAFRRVTDTSDGPSSKLSYFYAKLPANLDEWPNADDEELPGDWIRAEAEPRGMYYRIQTSDSRAVNGAEYDTQDDAEQALAFAFGWSGIATSSEFAVGTREGARGSVYGVECYETQEACDAAMDGERHAPRILRIRGDESWALGRSE